MILSPHISDFNDVQHSRMTFMSPPRYSSNNFGSALGLSLLASVLARSQNLTERESRISSLLLPSPALLTDCKKQLEEFFLRKLLTLTKKNISLQRCFSTSWTYSVTTEKVADSTERPTEPHFLVRFLFYKRFSSPVFCALFGYIQHSNIPYQELFGKPPY